jgi:hypothetical protein
VSIYGRNNSAEQDWNQAKFRTLENVIEIIQLNRIEFRFNSECWEM